MKTNLSVSKESMLDVIEVALKDIGVMNCVIKDIMEELNKQSYNVQTTFYYRMNGFTQEEVAEMIGVTQVRINQYINENLNEIKNILNAVL